MFEEKGTALQSRQIEKRWILLIDCKLEYILHYSPKKSLKNRFAKSPLLYPEQVEASMGSAIFPGMRSFPRLEPESLPEREFRLAVATELTKVRAHCRNWDTSSWVGAAYLVHSIPSSGPHAVMDLTQDPSFD